MGLQWLLLFVCKRCVFFVIYSFMDLVMFKYDCVCYTSKCNLFFCLCLFSMVRLIYIVMMMSMKLSIFAYTLDFSFSFYIGYRLSWLYIVLMRTRLCVGIVLNTKFLIAKVWEVPLLSRWDKYIENISSWRKTIGKMRHYRPEPWLN